MNKTKRNNVKITALLLALMLLIGGVVGGTLAWLVATTDPVVNTFTIGNITLTLTETWNTDGTDDDTDFDSWTGKLVPGKTLKKDPVVTVGTGSEACWVFVEVKEEGGNVTVDTTEHDFDSFINYEINPGWILMETQSDITVYYKKVDTPQSINVLKGNADYANGCVTIKDTVTKEMMDEIVEDSTKAPKLTFTAYAIQSENLTYPEDVTAESDQADYAWSLINNN